MDKELQDAMDLTKDDLLALRDAGRPAAVSRKPRADVATTAKRMMDAVIERTERTEPEERRFKFGAGYYVRLRETQLASGT